MNFRTDQQTLDDLNILGKPGKEAVFNIYNHTFTRGGADLLENMFLYPLTGVAAINNRSQVIQYFSKVQLSFPVKTEWLSNAEIYLAMTDPRSRLVMVNKLDQLLMADGDYKLISKGISALLEIGEALRTFIQAAGPAPQAAELDNLHTLLNEIPAPAGKINYEKEVALDGLFRFTIREKLQGVLRHIYHLDVYMTVAAVATRQGYTFPLAVEQEAHITRIKQVKHPLVPNAKANDMEITPARNVIFLTGANMAGKSTFMKSLGIALYVAHLGFPVAAEKMEFSVLDGMYTTINLPDDLGAGNSHFYAEVLRVKKVATEIASGKSFFVIFDELFRGTNVKDAYDGTIAIVEAFAKKTNSQFIISTHIVEAGAVLQERCSNLHFVYLPTRMNGNKPEYTYRLENGITADRHGMIIIQNERILEIFRSRKK